MGLQTGGACLPDRSHHGCRTDHPRVSKATILRQMRQKVSSQISHWIMKGNKA